MDGRRGKKSRGMAKDTFHLMDDDEDRVVLARETHISPGYVIKYGGLSLSLFFSG